MLSLLSHLALALAGVCLTCAEVPYIPEMGPALVVYLLLVAVAWRVGRRWMLRNWMANLLGLAIAGGAALWIWLRLSDRASWAREIELPGALIPYLGPILMALTLARLFRPQRREDFWVLQGLGLLQVGLGCVLAGDTLFGVFLLAYLMAALCALAAHERDSQGGEGRAPRRGWVGFAVRWAMALGVLTWPLFLVTPRVEGPEWQPLSRFRVEPGRQQEAHIGFSDEIDLNRASRLSPDYSIAFTVAVSDENARPRTDLPAQPRWRGTVLDRYEEGVWRSDLAWPGTFPGYHPSRLPRFGTHPRRMLRFEVPRNAGGLFLYEPIHLGEMPGELPIRVLNREEWSGPVPFFESGGTALAANVPLPATSRYVQTALADGPRDRFPAVRLHDGYLRKLLNHRVRDLEEWTVTLLRRLGVRPESRELAEALKQPRAAGWSLPPATWEAAARLLADHLARSGEYTYSLENRRVADDLDPVMDFLLNVREGSCERYASALTLMLRSVGIPARIIKGFRGAEALGDGTYNVLQSHAHAWVEAVVPASEGGRAEWIVLEPTPDGGDGGFDLGRWWQQQQRTSQGFWRDLIVNYNANRQAGLWEELTSGRLLLDALPFVGIVAALLFLLWWLRRMGRRWRGARERPAGLYARLREALARWGLRPRPGQTPRELAEAAAARLAGQAATASLADLPGLIVALYYRHRYGREAIDPAEAAALSARLRELESAARGAT